MQATGVAGGQIRLIRGKIGVVLWGRCIKMTNIYQRWANFKAIAFALLIIAVVYGSLSLARPKAREAMVSLADHLGFAFELGEAGTAGFPDPFKRHDPNKHN